MSPAEALAHERKMQFHADAALHHLKQLDQEHRRHCNDPECRSLAGALAFLAHSLGFGRDDIRAFESDLVAYELTCRGCNPQRRHGGHRP